MPLEDILVPLVEQRGFNAAQQTKYKHFCDDFERAYGKNISRALSSDARIEQFVTATLYSEFVQQQLLKQPQWLDQHCVAQNLQRSDYETRRTQILELHSAPEGFNRSLRHYRNAAMVGIIWRDFNRLVDTFTTTRELTWLAEICVQAALDYHYKSFVEKVGEPRNNTGDTQPLLVVGMGKLGAAELNLSSDIDLIFAFPQKGQTSGATRLENTEFFNRLGKQVIQSLDEITADGFVFRVDMRLRPFGQSGALVSHFDALEDYYQTQGRDWERYAMIKARVIASSLPEHPQHELAVRELSQLLNNFTYRKYVDFSVIEALRKLKQLITQEVTRRNLGDDVKLGAGGIREIEFIAQAFQLIRGGRDVQLQDNRVAAVLPMLEELHCLPGGMAQKLLQAYCFLRNTEHAIQGFQDRQTQKLPSDTTQRLRIAQVMGFRDWSPFYNTLQTHRELVKAEFNAVIANPTDQSQQARAHWRSLWATHLEPQEALAKLEHAGHEDPVASIEALEALRINPAVVAMQPLGRQRLDECMPLLLEAVEHATHPSATLRRILPLVQAIARRSAYLLLLIENPGAVQQLVRLAQASPWIAQQLALRPALLDELLDPRTLYHPPDKTELCDELRRATLRIPEDDEEAQLDALRYFRSSHALRVAACEVNQVLPLMKVSDYLTWLAEALLECIVARAWREMTARHGYPDGDARHNANFIVVGYGKLGGIELGHDSDLDLVFIHNASTTGNSDGNRRGLRSVDNQTFYMRLGQKIIHMLTTHMASGKLYDIDMRLRPSGNSGLLVATLTAFEKYQENNAWAWEHQALVRARVVAGDAALTQRFDAIRRRILSRRRDRHSLLRDVVDMRNKMHAHLGSQAQNRHHEGFHLKQDRGGIVDIEFMVQYAVLGWGHQIPGLITYTDNIRILECLAQSGVLSPTEVANLTGAYKAFRSLGHNRALQQQSHIVANAELSDEVLAARATVASLWHKFMTQAKPSSQQL